MINRETIRFAPQNIVLSVDFKMMELLLILIVIGVKLAKIKKSLA